MSDLVPNTTASCRFMQPVFGDDHTTFAIGGGTWLNGPFDGENTVHWKAVQTGESVGSKIYAFDGSLNSAVRGNERAGDDLLVTFQNTIEFPQGQLLQTPTLPTSESSTKKSAYYQALAAMSPSDAGYAFMVDELLEERCGKSQEIAELKGAVTASELPVLRDLKDGNVEAARELLAGLACRE